MKDAEILALYAEKKMAVKQLEKELGDIQPQVLEILEKMNVDELSTNRGKFVRTEARVWTFPEAVQFLEKELKRAKDESKQRGTARYDIRSELRFYEPKSEDSSQEA